MKYLFYAIVFDVAGNTTTVGSLASPAKTITTNIQKVEGISINPSSAQTKNIGDTFKITATVSPTDANNKSITWSSSNSGVATVDSGGNVRCLAAGTTTIIATAADGSGKSASLSLTVCDPLTSLTLDKTQTTLLYGGATTTVTANTTPSDYDANNLTWSIGDTSLATISGSGKTRTITSNNTKKTGGTTLTVSGGGKTATMKVSIVNFTTTTYSYTGSVQQVDLPAGTYKLEVWGAQGGGTSHSSYSAVGGYGGYSVGILSISSNTTIYIVVGGAGKVGTTYGQTQYGGYNGGGNNSPSLASSATGTNGYIAGSGGGATHIATKTGKLSSLASYKTDIILVAGGGGGGGSSVSYYSNTGTGGSGGGLSGGNGTYYRPDSGYSSGFGYGGNQDKGGGHAGIQISAGIGSGMIGSYSDGSFGEGGTCGAGGGGGLFGGGSGTVVGANSNWSSGGGGGGSGYINTSKLTNAFMYGYNVSTSNDTATKTYTTTNVSSTPTSNYAKSGDGAARITPIN